ncbi:hypothetical protein AB9Q10_24110 [Streptomyces krungchingensis]|uniref:hypothetical protein n=1 Tax=Streptomyces krungchingensis TaxID=1565034 RepID=UPI003CF475CE
MFQKVGRTVGLPQQFAVPSSGRAQELIRSCRALAIDLRAKAWDTVGVERIFAQSGEPNGDKVRQTFSESERAQAERVLDCYRGRTFFEAAVWCLLQLDPIDKFVLGGLASELGRAVAVRNSDKLKERLRDVQKHLVTVVPDELAPDREDLSGEELNPHQADQLPDIDSEGRLHLRDPEVGGGLF